MTRAAIYARFSSDRQNERSVDDQVRLCSERIAREGWEQGPVFADYAISGATRDRPGLNSLLDRANGFDVLVTESLDRLSRDQEDIAAIFKRLRFAGASIHTLSDGEVSEIHIGLRGTMSAMFLADLGEKTRRGQIGNVHAGRIPGGRSYGYAPAHRVNSRGQMERGWVEIDQEQAAIVRRIFAEYLAGRSPRAIASSLNDEAVPAPRGALWRASTITGSRARRNGILNNELYVGRIVFNRQRFEKDPGTRRRISRLNPADQWVVHQVGDLRIIDQTTWEAVADRLSRNSFTRPDQQRRPRRLLSGLVECGLCQGPVNVIGAERWGCARHRDTGQCDNNRTISTRRLEGRVIAALQQRMLAPDLVEAYIDEWRILTEEWEREREKELRKWQRQLDKVEGRINRLLDAIADGIGDQDMTRQKLVDFYDERDGLRASIADRQAAKAISIHPAVASDYARAVDQLQRHIAENTADADMFRNTLRPHIGKVVMLPAEGGRGAALELHGVLAEILRFGVANGPEGQSGNCMPTVVAGAGFEPATFRL